MKTLLITLALLIGSLINVMAASSPAIPGDSATYKLTVGFTNVAKRIGTLYVGLINDGADINGDSYRKTRIEIPATGEFQVSFDGLPAGKYAVKVFQDLNTNQKLDVSGHMPTEPFGFSTINMLTGPPTFDKCAFDLNASKTIAINLIGQ